MRETLAFGISILARKNVYLSLHSLYHMSRERTKYKCLKNTFSWKIWRLSEKYLLGSCRKVDNLHQFSLNLKSIFTEAIPSKTHYFQSFKVFCQTHIFIFPQKQLSFQNHFVALNWQIILVFTLAFNMLFVIIFSP